MAHASSVRWPAQKSSGTKLPNYHRMLMKSVSNRRSLKTDFLRIDSTIQDSPPWRGHCFARCRCQTRFITVSQTRIRTERRNYLICDPHFWRSRWLANSFTLPLQQGTHRMAGTISHSTDQLLMFETVYIEIVFILISHQLYRTIG